MLESPALDVGAKSVVKPLRPQDFGAQQKQAVTTVAYVNQDPAQGALITVENKGQAAMPVIADVTETSGKTTRVRLPVEVWQRSGTWTFRYNSTTPLALVRLNPSKLLPDANPTNNVWRAQVLK